MKKLTTILGAFFIASVVLISCGPSSEKGNWTDDDLDKCKSEIKKAFSEDPEALATLEMFGLEMDSFTECVCEKFEDDYDSFSDADSDSDLEDMSEEEAALYLMPCFGEDVQNLMDMEK